MYVIRTQKREGAFFLSSAMYVSLSLNLLKPLQNNVDVGDTVTLIYFYILF